MVWYYLYGTKIKKFKKYNAKIEIAIKQTPTFAGLFNFFLFCFLILAGYNF
jgi:hypothetical protein